MRGVCIVAFTMFGVGCASHHGTESVLATSSVFSDSTLHAVRCEPLRSGEDWRRVCVPKNQALLVR